MQNLNLVDKKSLIAFFARHNIPLEHSASIDANSLRKILMDAERTSHILRLFVSNTIVDTTKGTINCNFANDDEAFEMYSAFVQGVLRAHKSAAA